MIPITPLKLFRDWYIFYVAGQSLHAGISPFLVEGYFNPIQVAWLISFTTWIPFSIWAPLMIALSFLCVVLLAKKRSHWVLLSLPFIFGMTMGSLDLFLLVPARFLGGWGLSLLTLKPQLGMLLIPIQLMDWWQKKKYRDILNFFTATVLLWGIPTLINPTWLQEWWNALPPIRSRMDSAASISGFVALTGGAWVYILLFGIVFGLVLFKRSQAFYLIAAFSPSIWPSDWVITYEFITWRFTLLSWLLIFTGVSKNGAQFFFLLGLLIWLEQNPDTWKRFFLATKNRKPFLDDHAESPRFHPDQIKHKESKNK